MTKEEIEELLRPHIYQINDEMYIPIAVPPKLFSFEYQQFYNFFIEFNKNGVIKYKKLGSVKFLEYTDLLVEIIQIFDTRTTEMNRLKEIKKLLS